MHKHKALLKFFNKFHKNWPKVSSGMKGFILTFDRLYTAYKSDLNKTFVS